MMWAAFEEEYGLARHVYSVYGKAARAVPREQRAEVYRTFVAKARMLSGIPKVREVYALACEAEPPYEVRDNDLVELALEFAAVERDLQEIDRARCASFHTLAVESAVSAVLIGVASLVLGRSTASPARRGRCSRCPRRTAWSWPSVFAAVERDLQGIDSVGA
jgi:hypothetical protein